MTIRTRLFAAVAALVTAAMTFIEDIRDRISGDVDGILAGFQRTCDRLDSAAQANLRRAARYDEQADVLSDQIDVLEKRAEASADAAHRAINAKNRLNKLLG